MVGWTLRPTRTIQELVMRSDFSPGSAGRNPSALSSDQAQALRLGRLACQALIAEADLTPKPGLVDRRGPGAHTELSLVLMRRSAFAIEPFIRLMAFQSMNEQPSARLRGTLAATGRAAAHAMRQATNG